MLKFRHGIYANKELLLLRMYCMYSLHCMCEMIKFDTYLVFHCVSFFFISTNALKQELLAFNIFNKSSYPYLRSKTNLGDNQTNTDM